MWQSKSNGSECPELFEESFVPVASGPLPELESSQALKANIAKATVLIKESFLTVFILNSVLLSSVFKCKKWWLGQK